MSEHEITTIFQETSQKCETIDYKPPYDSIVPTIIRDLSKCNSGGDDPITTLSPAPDRTSSSTTKITTTTTAATTTTSTRTTTTSTTTISESTTTLEDDLLPRVVDQLV